MRWRVADGRVCGKYVEAVWGRMEVVGKCRAEDG